ncbi:uncharacterized protein LOC118802855 [Colossoma macropomum]|uniref:uncharacterized protein LOC118802855 n=1 Tax=Colossoma macropomum TaxID=42526 RepID=UPI001863CDDA|nr:uncharacterized protein LOC118802855 [Colossoma macropomum]
MCRCVCSLLLLLSFSRTCWGSSSAETLTVHPGENATLPCDVPGSPHMAWYQQSDNQLKLIISVRWTKAKTDIFEDYNQDSSHFLPVAESPNDSVGLHIMAVEQSDVGLYYCTGQSSRKYMIFGKAIHLTFPGAERIETGTGLCWKLLITSACILALALLLCVSGLLYRLGRPSSFCTNCVKQNSNLKAADLHYASLRHTAKIQERQPAPAEHNVTYDVVAKKIPTNPGV